MILNPPTRPIDRGRRLGFRSLRSSAIDCSCQCQRAKRPKGSNGSPVARRPAAPSGRFRRCLRFLGNLPFAAPVHPCLSSVLAHKAVLEIMTTVRGGHRYLEPSLAVWANDVCVHTGQYATVRPCAPSWIGREHFGGGQSFDSRDFGLIAIAAKYGAVAGRVIRSQLR